MRSLKISQTLQNVNLSSSNKRLLLCLNLSCFPDELSDLRVPQKSWVSISRLQSQGDGPQSFQLCVLARVMNLHGGRHSLTMQRLVGHYVCSPHRELREDVNQKPIVGEGEQKVVQSGRSILIWWCLEIKHCIPKRRKWPHLKSPWGNRALRHCSRGDEQVSVVKKDQIKCLPCHL